MEIEPFKAFTSKVHDFDCGNQDLNNFINSDEVRVYETENLGKTRLVYYKGELVAYFTISNHLLNKEKLKKVKSFSKSSELHFDGYPSILIGRLAVSNKWKGHNIGKFIVHFIIEEALERIEKIAARLIVVQAKQEAFGFYEKRGFVFVEHPSEDKRFKARGTRTMFFDLKTLMDHAKR